MSLNSGPEDSQKVEVRVRVHDGDKQRYAHIQLDFGPNGVDVETKNNWFNTFVDTKFTHWESSGSVPMDRSEIKQVLSTRQQKANSRIGFFWHFSLGLFGTCRGQKNVPCGPPDSILTM